MSGQPPTLRLSERHRSFLKQLFSEGYASGRYQKIRWRRDDLHASYSAKFGSMDGFTQMLDELVFQKLVGMKTSASGSLVEYHLQRSAIDYLASIQAFDSSTWTGLPARGALNPPQAENLVLLLEQVDRSLDGLELSNSERAAIRAYVCAAKLLAESPSPPADLIWLLIERADKVAGMVGLFVAIFALFAASNR